ncbi:hypothetical protein BJX63DRAFT_420781 [Aspergillus granulosus]|uniref:Uncharacterized protein n=1 Tax=Aspergillus granulosus TaxID=176169 RepID=A0ABR4HG15_9EURO
MLFLFQTRTKKTEITCSRNGCCDEGKPDCWCCITAGTDCYYNGFTLKFREATQWAAYKVESRRGLAKTPPSSTNNTVDERAGSLTDAHQILPPASYDCTVLPSAGLNEQSGGHTPVTFDENSPCQDLLNLLDLPKWADVPLDFDLLFADDADIFNEFLLQLSWTGMRNQPWEILLLQIYWPPTAGSVMILQPPVKARKPPPTKVLVFPLDLLFLWVLAIDLPAKDYSTWAFMSIYSTKAAAFLVQATRILEGGFDVLLNAQLTVMLLLIYYELEAGLFSDVFYLLFILSATILDHAKAVLSLAEGLDIICCVYTLLNPYGREDPAESIASRLEMSVATAAQATGDMPASMMKKVAEVAFDVSETLGHFLIEDELFAELCMLKMMLATCENPSALWGVATTTAMTASDGIAMEAIDYVFAQIVCDETLLCILADMLTTIFFLLNPWASVILHLASRLDTAQCGRENAYCRGGMLNTLYYMGLFCPGQVPLQVMHVTVQRLLDARVHAESLFFPVYMFAGGRTIFFACLMYDEWTTKDRLFSRGEKELVIVVGVEGYGRYFYDLVPVQQIPLGLEDEEEKEEEMVS